MKKSAKGANPFAKPGAKPMAKGKKAMPSTSPSEDKKAARAMKKLSRGKDY